MGTAALATALRWRGMSACRRVVAIAVCVGGGGEGIEVGYGGGGVRRRRATVATEQKCNSRAIVASASTT